MKKYVLLFFLVLLAGCGIFRSNSVKQSVADNQEGNDSQEIVEERLVAAVDQYIKQNKLDVPTDESGRLRTALSHPVIAATKEELTRLKAAWNSSGQEHEVLAKRFALADDAISEGLTFPPEGGQHNQWYQCDSCQRGLRTIDPHHHQCPSCNKIFSGFPYDNVLYSRHHSRNINRAEDAAWAWAVTGEKKYADFAAEVLLGYAKRYLNYPMLHASVNDKTVDVAAGKNDKYRTAGHISEQTLGEASLMIPAAKSYDLIYNSKALTAEQRQLIEDQFLRPMAECINGYKAGKSNWQTWHNAAILYAGAVMGDGNMLKQALLDDENGFISQMKISVLPEGMWYENSWGYHYYTLSAMTHLAEGGKHLGFDLYSHPLLRKMYLVAFDYLMADGSLPRFGDAVQDSPGNRAVNQKAYAVYNDERLLSTLPSEPSWDGIILGLNMSGKKTLPQPESKLIPGSGHAILATDGPGKLTAALTFGPYGGFHGHFDKLSFVFFGYGQELGVDPGRASSQAYRLPIHQEWYKATTGHNAVLVDGHSQKEADGRHLAFNANKSYAAITADAGPAFPNVSHKRFMLLSPSYLLIVDELKSEDGNEHSFDWLYHNKSKKVSCSLPGSDVQPGNIPPGYEYLKDITAYKSETGQAVSAKFTDEKLSMNMIISGQAGDEVFTATGPLASVEDRVPMIIVRRRGQTVRFAAVLEPRISGEKQSVSALTLQSGQDLIVSVTHDGEADHITFTGGKLENFKVWQGSESVGKILLEP